MIIAKLIAIDLETTPLISYGWSLYKPIIPFDFVKQDQTIICASWQDVEEKTVHTVSIGDHPRAFKKNPYDDYHVVKALVNQFNDGQQYIFIAHNIKFDMNFLNTRIAVNRKKHPDLDRLPNFKRLDTLQTLRQRYRTHSNKLDSICQQFFDVEKVDNGGFDTWRRIIEDKDQKALSLMEKYNRQDVVMLTRLFKEIRPHMNQAITPYIEDDLVCPVCNSKRLRSKGYAQTKTCSYKRYHCQDCGCYPRERIAEKDQTKPKLVT